jgi:hypothetical protein
MSETPKEKFEKPKKATPIPSRVGETEKALASHIKAKALAVLDEPAGGRAINEDETGNDAKKKQAYERLIQLIEQKQFGSRKGNALVIDTEKLKNNKEEKRKFQKVLYHFGDPLLDKKEQEASNISELVFRSLKSHIKVVDQNGDDFDYDLFVIKQHQKKPVRLGNRFEESLNEFLKEKKARRLWLKYPGEELGEDEAASRIDDEQGFLCLFDEERKIYRKISTKILGENSLQVFNAKGNAKEGGRHTELFDNPEVDLRRSDLERLNFLPRLLGPKNATPLINNIRYNFPMSEFTLPATGEKIKIDPARDTFLKLSDDYAALIINRGSVTTPYLLTLATKQQLEQEMLHRERLQKMHMTWLSAEETREKLSEWDITQFMPPRSNESPQQYAKRVGQCDDINKIIGSYRVLIDEADFDLQKYDLKKQLLFAAYHASARPGQKKNLYQLLRSYGGDFFNAFEACEFGLGMGDTIVKIAETHREKAIPIFKQFSDIMKIFEQKEDILKQLKKNSAGLGQKFDETRFYTAIVQRGTDLLNAIASKKAGEDLGAFVEEARQYHTDVILYGAQMASIAMTTRQVPLAPEAINNILSNVKIEVVEGGGLVGNIGRENMKDPGNYKDPKKFSKKDYETVAANLKIAYQKIDPGWLEYLTDNIPKDLNNPKVKFVFLRNRETGALVGLIKNKPDPEEPGAYYFGTLYVNSEFQKGFGIGEYLQKVAESIIPENAKIVATVAAANPAMERHIDNYDGIGTAIVKEGDDKHSSRELVKLAWRSSQIFITKNKQYFTREIIKSVAEGKKKLGEVMEGLSDPGRIRIHKLNTASENNREFLAMSRKYFSEGYTLTRVFYEKKDGKPDLGRTYLVFEKGNSVAKTAVKNGDERKEFDVAA